MERIIFWPFEAFDWLRHKWFGWCWPYCLPPREKLPNPDGKMFPIRLRCTKCGKVVEC
jgi:hypothetical protein